MLVRSSSSRRRRASRSVTNSPQGATGAAGLKLRRASVATDKPSHLVQTHIPVDGMDRQRSPRGSIVPNIALNADDNEEVILILSMAGACRRIELRTIEIDDISDHGTCLLVDIPKTKTEKPRKFAVVGKFYDVVKQYMALRPADYTSRDFFMKYQDGKCHRSNIGIDTFGIMPKRIAIYLQLPDPELYTGHYFRRSSATVYVNSGADIMDLKLHGGRASDKVAMGYVEESDTRKKQVGEQITNAIMNATTIPSKRKAGDITNYGLPSVIPHKKNIIKENIAPLLK